jgi:hypothetical protein
MSASRCLGVGFDPAHIELAGRLAAESGLANVHFLSPPLRRPDRAPDGALPDFDFIVSHGVLSWISRANRRHPAGGAGA